MSASITVKNKPNLDRLVAALGAVKVTDPVTALFGIPILTDGNMMDGYAALSTDCTQCMKGTKPGLCDRCLGSRSIVRFIRLP